MIGRSFFKALLAGAAASTVLSGVIAAEQGARKPPATSPATKKAHEPSEGERVFAENCSRCHTAPDGFSERISGTILRHMRVRASLSKQEEQALLHFLNPQ
jgi:mono/diheme cytochrome c family protein